MPFPFWKTCACFCKGRLTEFLPSSRLLVSVTMAGKAVCKVLSSNEAPTLAQVQNIAALHDLGLHLFVGQPLQVHHGHLGARHLHLREGIHDVWDQTCTS